MNKFINTQNNQLTDEDFKNALINIQHYINQSEMPLYIYSIIPLTNGDEEDGYTMRFELKFDLKTRLYDEIKLYVDVPVLPYEQIESIGINERMLDWKRAIKTKEMLIEILKDKFQLYNYQVNIINEMINKIK